MTNPRLGRGQPDLTIVRWLPWGRSATQLSRHAAPVLELCSDPLDISTPQRRPRPRLLTRLDPPITNHPGDRPLRHAQKRSRVGVGHPLRVHDLLPRHAAEGRTATVRGATYSAAVTVKLLARTRPHGETDADTHQWTVEGITYDAALAEVRLGVNPGWDLLSVQLVD